MRKFGRTLIAALVAGSALGVAIPAQAQYYPQQQDGWRGDRNDYRYDRDNRRDQFRGNANAIWRQIEQLRAQVERTDARDRISEREAASLRRAVYNLREQFRDYNRNGLSQREAQILQDRIHRIRDRLRYERRDDDGRRW